MKTIFVDTDILIDYSKGYGRFLEELLTLQSDGEAELVINPVVVAEFFADKNLKPTEKQEEAEGFLGQFMTVEVSKKMGLVAGQLIRNQFVDYLGDALIAATCLVNGYALATRNTRHYKRVPDLKLY